MDSLELLQTFVMVSNWKLSVLHNYSADMDSTPTLACFVFKRGFCTFNPGVSVAENAFICK